LIVDDEPYNLMGLQILLKFAFKKLGIKEEIVNEMVHEANNGQDAVNKVESNHIHNKSSYGIIFMDCSMPIMNGYEACKKIHNLF